MLRSSILKISTRKSSRRIPRQIATQIPVFLSSRNQFSSISGKNASQGAVSRGNTSKSSSYLPKIVGGGILVSVAALTAYQTGYLDHLFEKEQHDSPDSATFEIDSEEKKDAQPLEDHTVLSNSVDSTTNQNPGHDDQKAEIFTSSPHIEESSTVHGEKQVHFEDKPILAVEVEKVHVQEQDLPTQSQTTLTSDNQSGESTVSSDVSNEGQTKTVVELNEDLPATSASTPASTMQKDSNIQQVGVGEGLKGEHSIFNEYHLRDEADKTISASSTSKGIHDHEQFVKEKEEAVTGIAGINDAYIAKDGTLVLDFLQAIHAAERRQAELDSHKFSEEKRMLKEKYEKELKDARARELMYAEEAAILDKELSRERMKGAAAIKSLQEIAEEKLNLKLKQKEIEAELKLKEVEEIAKAELAAAIASEKASQIEKMAEANLHINALCMAFYARSEEVRQSHSVHKLALGALALEDALSKGLPIQAEIQSLHAYLEGVDKDSLLDLVLSSLPDETRNHGTDTRSELHQKFDSLKGTLRHFSLIPHGGGGILAHSLARVASLLKVKETGEAGDGIEYIISKVDNYIAEGRLAEAADLLDEGVRSSRAADVVGDWVTRARNRAITEQALTLLQSYATAISLT